MLVDTAVIRTVQVFDVPAYVIIREHFVTP